MYVILLNVRLKSSAIIKIGYFIAETRFSFIELDSLP